MDDGVRISVTNETDGALPLVNVTVTVRGDSTRVGDLSHGERETVRLHPKGESDVTLAFVLDGHAYAATGGYIEASGYRVELVVREHGAIFMCTCLTPALNCYGPFRPLSK